MVFWNRLQRYLSERGQLKVISLFDVLIESFLAWFTECRTVSGFSVISVEIFIAIYLCQIALVVDVLGLEWCRSWKQGCITPFVLPLARTGCGGNVTLLKLSDHILFRLGWFEDQANWNLARFALKVQVKPQSTAKWQIWGRLEIKYLVSQLEINRLYG